MFEWVKELGSLLGLVTGVVYFFDRLAKGRPIASLTISQPEGRRKLASIRIVNVSQYDIAILDFTVEPATYFLSDNIEVGTLVRGAAGQKNLFMLKPDESKELIIAPLFIDGLALEAGAAHSVCFTFWWRRGNATWLPQFPVRVRTSTTTIRKYGLEENSSTA